MFVPFGRGNWWNVTKAMLLRAVYMMLWTCTIIGFPIKYYAYRMVPYLLAENPHLKPTEAILLSRRMMDGNKWRCFVLDLTLYLHWSLIPTVLAAMLGTGAGLLTGKIVLCQSIATVLTGLLSLLFVNGYKSAVYTELYVALRQAQIDAAAPLADRFTVQAFGEAAPTGAKPRLPDADVHLPEDPVFHFAQHHKLNYNRHYSIRTLILLFFAFLDRRLAVGGRAAYRHQGYVRQPRHHARSLAADLWRGRRDRAVLLRKLFTRPVATFFVSMVLCSIIEYFTSWYLEFTKGIRWWDYSGYFMNLNGRICLEGAVTFGLACCAVVYFAGPLLGGLIDKLSPAKQNTICAVLIALFAADAVYSHFHPNEGAGITDYNDWQSQEGGSQPAAEAALSASTAPKHG